YSGQPVSVQSGDTGGTGQPEVFTQLNTYAYEVSDAAFALHLLKSPAQQSTIWSRNGSTPAPVKATATTYTGFPSVWGPDVLVPGAEGAFAWVGGAPLDFPFGTYEPGQTPAGWLPTSR